MATNIPVPITTRETPFADATVKGAPLTNPEVDQNLINLKKAIEEIDGAANLLFDTATGELKSETVSNEALKDQVITYAKIADIHYANDDSATQNTIRVRLDGKNQVSANELFFVNVLNDNTGPVSVQVEKSPATTDILSLSYLAATRTVTVVTEAEHGIISGDVVNISGATDSNYDQQGVIATRISSTSFSYVIPGGDPEPEGGLDGSENPTSATVESQLKVLVGATQLYRDADTSIDSGTIKGGSMIAFIYTGSSFRLVNSFNKNVEIETVVNNISEYAADPTDFPGNGLNAELIHGFTVAPASVHVTLICTNAADGYNEDDEIDIRDAFSADGADTGGNVYNQPAFSVHSSDYSIVVTQNTASPLIQSKQAGSVGNSVAASSANWKIKVRALFYQDNTNEEATFVQPPIILHWNKPISFVTWNGNGFVTNYTRDGRSTLNLRSSMFDMKTANVSYVTEMAAAVGDVSDAKGSGAVVYWIDGTTGANSHFSLIYHGHGTQIRRLLLETDNTNPAGSFANIATSNVRASVSGQTNTPLFMKPSSIPSGVNPAFDPSGAGFTPRHAPGSGITRLFYMNLYSAQWGGGYADINSMDAGYVDVNGGAATYNDSGDPFSFLDAGIGNIAALTGTNKPESFTSKSVISGIAYNPIKRRIYLLSASTGLLYIYKFRGKLGDNKAESGTVTLVEDPDSPGASIAVDASNPATWLGSLGTAITSDAVEWYALLDNGQISNDIDSWWHSQNDTNVVTTGAHGVAANRDNYLFFEKAIVIGSLGETDSEGGQNFGSRMFLDFNPLTGEEKALCFANYMWQFGNKGHVSRYKWREPITA